MQLTPYLQQMIDKARAEGRTTERSAKPLPSTGVEKTSEALAMQSPGWSVTLVVPVKTLSEMNMRSHWRVRYNRFQAQKAAVGAVWMLSPLAFVERWKYPLLVTLTRIGPRRLDDDNLAGSAKAIRDKVAELIGVDDGDVDRVTWRYEQKNGVYGVEIKVEMRKDQP